MVVERNGELQNDPWAYPIPLSASTLPPFIAAILVREPPRRPRKAKPYTTLHFVPYNARHTQAETLLYGTSTQISPVMPASMITNNG